MKKITLTVLTALTALTVAQATQYSCLSIISESKKIGKWQRLKTWIETAGLKDEWDKCAFVSDEYPQYATITNALVTGGVFDEDELRALMNAAKDTAVSDKFLRKFYETETRNGAGRSKWHGKLERQIIDTNTWTKTSIYADGTRFVDAARRPAAKTARAVAMTNGVPVRLAAARRRWADAKNNGNETNVTVTVRAGE